MWRSEFDLLVMAKEHNRDLIREAEQERQHRKIHGTLTDRIRAWLATTATVEPPSYEKPVSREHWQTKTGHSVPDLAR